MLTNTTLKFEYGGGVKEHILVVRGRPFSVLESPNIPTPNTTYIDYKLVKELGLKVANLTYEKMSYCGQKMRKIGMVAVTTQCLIDGRALGSVALKATVVLGLSETIEADAVAGYKLLSVLSSSSPTSPSPPAPSPRASPPRTPPSGRPSPRRSPTRGSPSPSVAPSPSSPHGRPSPTHTSQSYPSSPPGYPDPIFTPVLTTLNDQLVTLSPRSTNLSAFKHCFDQVDEKEDPSLEMMYLEQVVDPEGVADGDGEQMRLQIGTTHEADQAQPEASPGARDDDKFFKQQT